MTCPLFSIIIPVFNSKDKLSQALDSIMTQECTDYEVIMIDGFSTDGTIHLIQQYQTGSDKIKYISEKDNGIYDAMNKGIQMASGRWLYFLGSDDEMYSRSALKHIADHPAMTAYNVIYGNAEIVGNTSWSKDGDKYDGIFDLKKLLSKNICHQSIFYKTDFIKNEVGQYNIKYRLCADWDFNLRCFSKTEFAYTDEVIAKFYGGGESTRRSDDRKFSDDFVPNLISYFNLSPFDPMLDDPQFFRYYDILMLQKQTNFSRYLAGKFKRKFFS